jgi:hypothetical protein
VSTACPELYATRSGIPQTAVWGWVKVLPTMGRLPMLLEYPRRQSGDGLRSNLRERSASTSLRNRSALRAGEKR